MIIHNPRLKEKVLELQIASLARQRMKIKARCPCPTIQISLSGVKSYLGETPLEMENTFINVNFLYKTINDTLFVGS